jgi:hypothetical protein
MRAGTLKTPAGVVAYRRGEHLANRAKQETSVALQSN